MSEGPWTIAGTVLAAIILAITLIGLGIQIYAEFFARKKREAVRLNALKHPAYAYFVIHKRAARIIDWAEQDDADHYLKEITLPSNSEATVDIAIHPLMHFRSSAILFGCQDSTNIDGKPYAIRQENHFILEGADKICEPGKHPDHAITTSLYYQVRGEKSWSVGTDSIRGFAIKTRKPGDYKMDYCFVGGEVEGVATLMIHVVDNAPIMKLKIE
jgi:hypothetical protein